VDNSTLRQIGPLYTGEQRVFLKLENGEDVRAINHFTGKLEFDRLYEPSLKVIGKKFSSGDFQIIDIYRIHYEIILAGVFIFILFIYGGWVGFKAFLSFIFSCLLIWKILLPGFLYGLSPFWLSLGCVFFLSFVILFLVGGFQQKSWIAFVGCSLGILATAFLSLVVGSFFQIPGSLKPFSESLLYAGFGHLDLSEIFLCGIFISSSGAVMDIAMDLSASLVEIEEKCPQISFHELFFSGIKIGRAVSGTMTTTLLLAYSGGFTFLLMFFMVKGTSLVEILNKQYVAAEILQTLVGSMGLILVAPLTALIGSFWCTRKIKKKNF